MKQKIVALLLVLLLVSTVVVSAFAAEANGETGRTAQETAETTAETEAESAETTADETEEAAEEAALAAVEEEPVAEVEEASPNMIMFADLAELVKKNSPAYKAAQSSAGAIDDAQESVSEMQAQLDQINAALSAIESNPELEGTPAVGNQTKAQLLSAKAQLQSGISGLSSFSGQSSAQANAGGKQVIMACESVYIALVDLEVQEAALVRTLEGLDRTLAELRVRAEWGQVSQLQLMEAESGRAELVSGLTTLRMNMTNLRMQLECLLGEKLTGTAEVGVLPKVTAEQLTAVDLEKDLKTVLRKNPDIQAAEDQEDALYSSGMGGMGDVLGGMRDAADYSVQNTRLQVEMKFRSLYAQLLDCQQVVAAKQQALEVEQLAYQAAELKYNQGTISKNVLLTAADDLQTARDAVVTAENSLFSTYNQYNWAVNHGVFM